MSTAPIAGRLIARMKRKTRGKLVNIKDVVAGRTATEKLQNTVVTEERLKEFHPAHAPYVYAQNQVSVMSEQLTELDEMQPFVEIVSEAEDLYMPSGPPMSPLTASYFTSWAFFDVCIGHAEESIGTVILEVGAAFGMHKELLRLIRLMQRSRMGVFLNEGVESNLVVLRELVTDAVCRAIVPAGYCGRKGELWYARVLPPPVPGVVEHVVFTTPYILLQPGLPEWKAYWCRVLPQASPQARIEAYARHMKHGPTPDFWNEFVLEGYVNDLPVAIFLAGLPDVPESRPHSRKRGASELL